MRAGKKGLRLAPSLDPMVSHDRSTDRATTPSVERGAYRVGGIGSPPTTARNPTRPIEQVEAAVPHIVEIVPDEHEIQRQIQQQADSRVQTVLNAIPAANVVANDDDNDGNLNRGHARTRKNVRILVVVCVLVLLAAVSTTVGVLVGRNGGGGGANRPCGFCHGLGGNPFVWEDAGLNQTCTLLLGKSSELLESDVQCAANQAVAWRLCGCPDLPPNVAANSTCSLCRNVSHARLPLRLSTEDCVSLDSYVSIVGTARPEQCTGLVEETIGSCYCQSDLFVELENILVSNMAASRTELTNVTSPRFQALRWLSSNGGSSLNTTGDVGLVLDRYALAVLFYATNGWGWSNPSTNFLSSLSVCEWKWEDNITNMGIECDEQGRVISLSLGEFWPFGAHSNLSNFDPPVDSRSSCSFHESRWNASRRDWTCWASCAVECRKKRNCRNYPRNDRVSPIIGNA